MRHVLTLPGSHFTYKLLLQCYKNLRRQLLLNSFTLNANHLSILSSTNEHLSFVHMLIFFALDSYYSYKAHSGLSRIVASFG